MNQSAIRLFVRSLITEAKEEKAAKLPKSSGKLMDLKKELAALEQMKEEIQTAKFAEKTAETEVEFANLSKFAKELDKIKAGGVALEASIDAKIEEIKGKIDAQKSKIKEMIGMTQPAMVDEKKEKKEKKADTSASKSKHEKGETKEEEKEEHKDKKKAKELDEARFEKGEDVGKPGKGFAKIAKSAAKQYGSKKAGQKVAGAILKKVVAKGK